MIQPSVLSTAGILVMAAATMLLVARRVGAPAVVAYVAGGLMVGAVVRAWEVEGSVLVLAELSLVVVLFVTATELGVERVRPVWKVAVLAGTGRLVIAALMSMLLSLYMQVPFVQATVISVAWLAGGGAVAVRYLKGRGAVDSRCARLTIGILAVQSLVALMALTIVTVVVDGSTGGGQRSVSAAGRILALAGVAVLGGLACRWLRPRLHRAMSSAPSATLIWALAWCFLGGAVALELGVPAAIGAYAAGLGVAAITDTGNLRASLRPLLYLGIAMMFVSQGAQVVFSDVRTHALVVVASSACVVTGNLVLVARAARQTSWTRSSAWRTGLTTSQLGEPAFIVGPLAVAGGWIAPSTSSAIVLVSLATACVSAFVLERQHTSPTTASVADSTDRFGSTKRLET
jgi:Kef-type K+ transport system membrane component KefB